MLNYIQSVTWQKSNWLYLGFSKISMILIVLNILLFSDIALSQNKQIPDEVQIQIDNYRVNAIKNRNIGNDNVASTYLNKIAFLYWEYFIYDKAVNYFEEVLVINQNLQNTSGAQKVLDNIAFVYSDMERYDKSVECFLKSLQILEQSGDKVKISIGLSNLATAYSNNGQYTEAVNIGLKGLEMSKSINDIKLIRAFYGVLYESYDKLGDSKKSVEYFSLYSTMDKLIQENQYREKEAHDQQVLSQMEAEKDQAQQTTQLTQKELVKTRDTLKAVEQITKEQMLSIELLNSEKKVQEAKLLAEKRLRYFFFAIFIMLTAIAFLIYWQMQQKKKANDKLKLLNQEIEKKNRQILDSINYASHIQEAILPYEKSIKEHFPESFILYKPRDIVSGDFYWYSKKGSKVFIAAIDCTGHGVPGAFMSMIGNTLLSEIINEKEVTNPAEVLDLLNQKVIYTLNQDNTDKEGFSEDGMDMTLCVFDLETKILELALANHSAIIFTDGKPTIIEGDIFSIGGHVGGFGTILFKRHSIKLTEPINLYMFSDGYQDQFGGKEQKKYLVANFIKKLTEIQPYSFEQQAKMLDEEFLKWKGNNKQVDDILVIGLSIPF